jgi:hypothetical protein
MMRAAAYLVVSSLLLLLWCKWVCTAKKHGRQETLKLSKHTEANSRQETSRVLAEACGSEL